MEKYKNIYDGIRVQTLSRKADKLPISNNIRSINLNTFYAVKKF